MAAADGRQQVYPEDVKALLPPVLGHRIMMTPDAILRGEKVHEILERVVGRIKPPLLGAGGNGAPTGEGRGDGRPRSRAGLRSRQGAGAKSGR
jgi:hypothetical protein